MTWATTAKGERHLGNTQPDALAEESPCQMPCAAALSQRERGGDCRVSRWGGRLPKSIKQSGARGVATVMKAR